MWWNNERWELRTPIAFDNEYKSNLLDALNSEVVALGDSDLYTWITDETTGLPIFGTRYIVTCPNVKHLTAKTIIDENILKLVVDWEDDNALSWQIKVIEKGLSDDQMSYSHVLSRTSDTISSLIAGKTYDIYVRPICGENIGGWGQSVQILYDKPLWTEVITSQPTGFIEDEKGNAIISSNEGLAWFALTCGNYFGKQVELVADVDLSMYRWSPIMEYQGIFDGNNHIVSNIYVNSTENMCGLFGSASNATIKNIVMEGGNVKGATYVGGILGLGRTNCNIENCHSSVEVYAEQQSVGSLCGSLDNSVITNCSSSGNVYGKEGVGGLIGWLFGGTVKNCYSSSNIYPNLNSSTNYWYVGGVVGYFAFSTMENCYTSGKLGESESIGYAGRVIGCPDYNCHIHCIYGESDANLNMELTGNYCNDIYNISLFHHDANTNTLLTPATIDKIQQYDLLAALNAWVRWQNDPTLLTWALDPNTGLPVFAEKYVPSCYNPTDVMISNATLVGDTTIQTKIEWTQVGEPDHWEVLYVNAEQSKDSGTIISVANNPCFLTELPVGKPLDFYVRSICNEGETSGWSPLIRYMPEKLRWTEIVTTQPEGYVEDTSGDIYISSAEGLAWLSSIVNGLNGNPYIPARLRGKQINITNDIDLSGYRWTPIGINYSYCLEGVDFIGNNHTVSNLYCNELADFQGLIGFMIDGKIRNLNFLNSSVSGENYVGTIIGYASSAPGIDWVRFDHHSVDVINCAVNGNVCGISKVGGLVGRHYSSGDIIANSSYRGSITIRNDITKVNTIMGYAGGICGSLTKDTIVNCYVVSEVIDTIEYSGIITGSGGSPDMVANCYSLEYTTSLPMTASDITSNLSFFTGSGTSWTLNTPPYVNGAFRTDLIDALNAWVEENNSEGLYRYWAADSANVNGGFPVFAALPKFTVTFQDWDGTELSEQQVEKGTMAIAPPSPQREGYSFIGWDTDFTNVQSDLVVTALYSEATSIGNIDISDTPRKVVRDGQIYILRGNKTYAVTGQEVK